MTSASELFYNRRSRISRFTAAGALDPESDSPPDRIFHCNYNRRHHNSHNQHRRDFDGCDHLRRSPHVRQGCNRVFYTDHESVGPEQGTSQSLSSNHIYTENLISASRPIFSRDDRLPGSVLLARERLVERLRGPSISENRRSRRSSPANNHTDYMFPNDLSFVNTDWETSVLSGSSSRAAAITHLLAQAEGVLLRPENKKPPGLTQEALDSLQLEVYSSKDSRNSRECGICLENFIEGDNLLCLPCKHMFHPACLEPWLRACGDCPYCRRGIVLTSP